MKIGVIVLLAVSLIVARPVLQAQAVTDFAREGTGPVFAGSLFPFVFITIACGALSGFHALIASGTTPKMLAKESQVRLIGYGGMLMESFVAISALIAACVIDQGLYFAMNSPAGATGGTVESAAAFINGLGFDTSAQTLGAAAAAVQEDTLISRTGGAPTLAVGISQIFSTAFGGGGQAFWYHFAIMFEALFILTAVDAGTQVGRFMLQDTIGNVWKRFGDLSWRPGNIMASAIVVGLWGSVLYIGVTDPLGGVNQLFPLFGIANQLLAAIALTLVTVLLIKHGKLRYAWVTAIPLVWDLVVTMTASYQKVFSDNPAIGYFAQAQRYRDAEAAGELLAPAQDQGQMDQIIFNSTLNGILQSFFAVLVLIVVVHAAVVVLKAIRAEGLPTTEEPAVPSSWSSRRASSRRRRRSGRSPSTSGWSARAPVDRRRRSSDLAPGPRLAGRALVPEGVHRRGELGPLPGPLRRARARPSPGGSSSAAVPTPRRALRSPAAAEQGR